MNFELEIWNILKLNELYNQESLNLNPPYQRNAIWSLKSQKLLIDTIKKEMPIPAFFLQEKDDGNYEMVDGQQRTRALLAYVKKGFVDNEELEYSDNDFKNYKIAVNILSKKLTVEQVREFYVRVNSSGAKLERPELNKAEYYDTSFLKLVTELSDLPEFRDLNLFTPSVKKRMFDRDFVEELVALLLFGENDKKKAVDQLFKKDINKEEYLQIKKDFSSIIKIIFKLNEVVPLSKTRFNQKNDFYTLFGLVKLIKPEPLENKHKLFKNLVGISKGIFPSNENCEILQDYARNCVTQSNSKKARERRLDIISKILLNPSEKPNKEQKQVADYFEIEPRLEKVGDYHILSL